MKGIESDIKIEGQNEQRSNIKRENEKQMILFDVPLFEYYVVIK